jgi:hypothetical protein
MSISVERYTKNIAFLLRMTQIVYSYQIFGVGGTLKIRNPVYQPCTQARVDSECAQGDSGGVADFRPWQKAL